MCDIDKSTLVHRPVNVNHASGSQKSPSFGSSAESVSSMETVPTDAMDGYESEEEENEAIWGRLFPVGTSFSSFDLVKEEYTFGRGETCDYQFNTPAMRKHPCFQAYSKVHFILTKEKLVTGMHMFLIDKSSNGTFVNGEKVGKGNKQVLNNNDEIALALKRNKAFVFMDTSANEDKDLPEKIKEKYTLSKLLGRGACGEVKLAFEKGSCRKFAVKIIQKKKFSIGGKTQVSNMSEAVKSEVDILKSLKHPCIIGIEDVVDTPDTIFIILELVEGGELFDRVVSLEKLDEPTAKLMFYQMAAAIKYLHDQGITHRDLKPENILLGSDDHETIVKVTDFGLSKFVDQQTMMKTFCGTPNYIAPEVLLSAGVGAYTSVIDCWSLGVILFICLVGYPPFSDERKDMNLTKQIVGGHYDMPNEYWSSISDDAKDVVKKLMTVDAKKRMTLQEALDHTWLKDETMRQRAHKLMYPESGDMLPPASLPKKRKGELGPEDGAANKRKSTAD